MGVMEASRPIKIRLEPILALALNNAKDLLSKTSDGLLGVSKTWESSGVALAPTYVC